MNVVDVDLKEEPNGWWVASPAGKMAPILEPVPGNTRPAQALCRRTRQELIDWLLRSYEASGVRVVIKSHTRWRDGRFEVSE